VARSGLRVVAGTAGGRRLVAPASVRPTTDRVREALFASLGDHVVDARVLDLYAGSGALGIEALSRGAAAAVFVDADRAAIDACRANLATTGLAERAQVHPGSVATLLGAGPPTAPFDLVVADPPYADAAAAAAAILAALGEPGWLTPHARVVLETPTRAGPPSPAAGTGWEIRSERKYGDTLLTTLGPVPTA
jgi:16S rRNA (guanine966-N2)-methyltransferase